MWTNRRYAFVHWLATMVLGRVVFVIWAVYGPARLSSGHLLESFMLVLVYGTVFSLPTLVLHTLASAWMVKRLRSVLGQKVVLNLLVIAAIGVTLGILRGGLMPALFCCYSTAVIVSSLFIKLAVPSKGPVVDGSEVSGS